MVYILATCMRLRATYERGVEFGDPEDHVPQLVVTVFRRTQRCRSDSVLLRTSGGRMKLVLASMMLYLAASASSAVAQTTIALWDFNALGLSRTGPAPSIGAGTASLVGCSSCITSRSVAEQVRV